MDAFENHKLGETGEKIHIDTAEQHRLAVAKMAQQARVHIDVISRDLEPLVYDTVEFIEALKRLVLGNRRARVRIITFEPQAIVTRGHRLLELAGSLSSFFDLRRAGQEHKDYDGSLFIADALGYIKRSSAERYEGTLNFNDPRESRILLAEFEEMWGKAGPDPNFRKFMI